MSLGLGLDISKSYGISNNIFISTWKTDNLSTGSSANNQVKLPLVSSGTYDFVVDWGDGNQDTITTYNQAEVTHTYSNIGTYEVKIDGVCEGWQFNNNGDRLKILSILSWGKDFRVGNLGNYFFGCENLRITTRNRLIVGNTTTFFQFFRNCFVLNDEILFSDTTNVTNVSGMFNSCYNFNKIVNFKTSNAINFSGMFYRCYDYNQAFAFDIGNAVNIGYMFYFCSDFNQDISIADMSNVTDSTSILSNATSFSTANYDKLLISLASQNVSLGVSFGCSSRYTLGGEAETARTYLINTKFWTITDLGGV